MRSTTILDAFIVDRPKKGSSSGHPCEPEARGKLIRALANQSVVTFVGSGLSTAAGGYPLWNELPQAIVDEVVSLTGPVNDPSDPSMRSLVEELRKVIKTWEVSNVSGKGHSIQDPILALSAMSRVLRCSRSGSSLESLVRMIWDQRQKKAEAEHRERIFGPMLQLPLHRFATTNYDYEIEQALCKFRGAPDDQQPNVTTRRASSLSFDQTSGEHRHHARFCISSLRASHDSVFHCHGSVGRPETLIITDEHYATWYYNEGRFGREVSYLQSVVNAMLRSNTVLFIGFSVKDREIQRLLRPLGAARYRSQSRGHFFLLDPMEGNFEQRMEFLWSEFGIITVGYEVLGEKGDPNWAESYGQCFSELEKDLEASLNSWSKMPVIRSAVTKVQTNKLNLWGSKSAFGNASLGKTLEHWQGRIRGWIETGKFYANDSITAPRVVLVEGPAGTGKLKFARQCFDFVPIENTCEPERKAVYVNIQRVQDIVSAIDRLIQFLNPSDDDPDASRSERLRRAIGKVTQSIIVINGFERLLLGDEVSNSGRPFMPFISELIRVLCTHNNKTLTIITSRTRVDLESIFYAIDFEVKSESVDETDLAQRISLGARTDRTQGVQGAILRIAAPSRPEKSDGMSVERIIGVNSKLKHFLDIARNRWRADVGKNCWSEEMKREHGIFLDDAAIDAQLSRVRRRQMPWTVFEIVETSIALSALAGIVRKRNVVPRSGALSMIRKVCIEIASRLAQSVSPIPFELGEAVANAIRKNGDRLSLGLTGDTMDCTWDEISMLVFNELGNHKLWIAFEGPIDSYQTAAKDLIALDRDYAEYVLRWHLGNRSETSPGVDMSDFTSPVGIISPTCATEGSLTVSVFDAILKYKPDGDMPENEKLRIESAKFRTAFSVMRSRMPAVTATEWQPEFPDGESPRALPNAVVGLNWSNSLGLGPHDLYASRIAAFVAKLREFEADIDRGDPGSGPVEFAGPRRLRISDKAPLFAGDYVWLYNELAHSMLSVGLLREALAISKLAVRFARLVDVDHQYQPYVVEARLKEMQALIRLGLLSEANRLIEISRPLLGKRDHDPELHLRLDAYSAYVLHLRGSFRESDQLYESAVTELRRYNVRASAYFGIKWGHMCISAGDLARAKQCFQESLSLALRLDLPVTAINAKLGLVRYFRRSNDLESAQHHLLDPYHRAVSLRLHHSEADARYEMSSILAAHGDRERAKREALASLHVANRFAPGLLQTKAMIAVGRSHLPSAKGQSGLRTDRLASITPEDLAIAWTFLDQAKDLAVQQTYWVRAASADELLVTSGLAAWAQNRQAASELRLDQAAIDTDP